MRGTGTRGGSGFNCGAPRACVGSPVTVGTGAGYVTLQTTTALLKAANTSARLGVQIDHNEAVANKITGAGDFAVLVAWLNDGTQTIQNLGDGTSSSGATPAITGTLVTGIGWRATLDAQHRVVIELAQDGIKQRKAQARYWCGEEASQVDP